MTRATAPLLFALAALPAHASETRQLEAHEHGTGALNIAIEGQQLAMELEVPGADIVGFEHAAKTDADRAAIEAALATLSAPQALFALPASAGCALVEVSVELDVEDDDHDHDHDEDHAEADHDHDHGEGHAHDDHAHDDHDHAAQTRHSEFEADYLLDCGDVSEIVEIAFPYFDRFPNAEKLEIQLVTDQGASAREVTRDAPVLDLRNLF